MIKNILYFIFAMPLMLVVSCSNMPSTQSPTPQNLPAATVITKRKMPVSSSSSIVSKKAVAPPRPSKKLEHQVTRYNDLLTQARSFDELSTEYLDRASDASSKWEDTYGMVSDDHPYPQNIQFLFDTGSNFNRKQAQVLRKAAIIHRHLMRSPDFARYYIEAELALDHDHIPGDLFNTDAEKLHFIRPRYS